MSNLKSFKNFVDPTVINEEVEQIDNVDTRFLENNLERLNQELDEKTENPYRNAPIFLAQLRGILERYGIQLPVSANDQFIDLGAEMIYTLGDSGYHLYVVYDTDDDGYVNGYAQVVDEEDLEDLEELDSADLFADVERRAMKLGKPWTPPARKDDDSGNDSEYA